MNSRGAVNNSPPVTRRTRTRRGARAGLNIWPLRGALCGLVIFAALACAALTAPTASAWRVARRAASPAPATATAAAPSQAARVATKAPAASVVAPALFPALAPQAAPGPEGVQTYAADCTTPKSVFNLGETVCAKYADAPTYAFFALRRVFWVNTAGHIFQPEDVLVGDGTATFTIPTNVVSTEGFDRRGGWSVNLVSTADGSVRASAAFTVRDPANAAANLSVFQVSEGGAAVVQSNSNVTYAVLVVNRGPDAAENVLVTHNAPTVDPAGTAPTFIANGQSPGSNFTFPTDTTATLASMPAGTAAVLTFTYNVPGGTPAYTVIKDVVEVESDTTDPRMSDNDSTDFITVLGQATVAECTLDCPANIATTANTTHNGQPGAFVSFGAAAVFGDCGAVTNSPASGTFFTVGTHIITSTSESGPSCTFTVKVLGTPAPTISCPANITAPAGNDGTATVTVGTPTFTASGGGTVVGVRSDGTPAVTDEDGTVITPAVTPALNAPYPAGTTAITWTVTDADGRTATCTQRVFVVEACANDTQAPTINAPADITVSTGADNTGCAVALDDELGQAETDDDCPGSVTVTVSGIPAGALFPKGTTVLTYTATDGAGRTASDTQSVTVVDDTPPRIAAPADAAYTCLSAVPAAHPSQATRGEVFDENGNLLPPGPPFDNCGAPGVAVNETNNGGAGSAASPLVITRTYTATDSAGLTSSATQTITVSDGAPPTITAPANVQVAAGALTCTATNVALGTPATADNCSVASVTNNAPATFALGSTTVTWTVTDAAGNTATAAQTVTVVDQTPPVITVLGVNPATVLLGGSYVDAGATAADACAGSVAVTTTGSVNTGAVGTYTLTYSATDAANNTATATRTVKVIYNFTGFFSPVANLPSFNNVNAGRSIPVKFSLNGNQGLGIMAADFPASQQVSCSSTAPLSELEGTETPGGSTLTYSGGQYHYNWKTESSWAGTCRRLNVKLIDGTEHTALFKFK